MAAAVAGAVGLATAVQAGLAYRDATAGARAATIAPGQLTAAQLQDGGVEASLERARRLLASAHRRAGGVLLAPVRALPVIGPQMRSFRQLTASAERVAAIGALTTESAQATLGPRPPSPERRVKVLRDLADLVTRADHDLDAVPSRPGAGLVGPLHQAWRSFDRRLTGARTTLQRAAVVLEGTAGFLSGPRHYLLLAANNAEMRAGSGMFLSAGTLDSAAGTLTVSAMRPTGDLTLPGAGVPLDGDLAARWGWLAPGREWRNLGSSPRFDVSAPLAARMWESLTGEQVDGVIAVDVAFLRAMLAATGPVDPGGTVVSASTVVGQLLHDQYLGLDFSQPVDNRRRDELSGIAQAVVRVASAGDRLAPLALAQGLVLSARGRHLLAWSGDEGDQRGWEAAGISGRLSPDSLAVSVLSRGGNKLDQFLQVHQRLGVRVSPGTTDVTVAVEVRNDVPRGEPPYVSGPNPESGANEGDYLGIVAVNVPAAATALSMDDNERLVAAGPDGPTAVVATPLRLVRGEARTVLVRFRLPGAQGSLVVSPSARLPVATWEGLGTTWPDDASHRVAWGRR